MSALSFLTIWPALDAAGHPEPAVARCVRVGPNPPGPKHMPEKMPERMPDRMPGRMPDSMPDRMPDRMLEYR